MTRPGNEQFLDNYSDEVNILVSHARTLVIQLVHNAIEKVQPGWKVINYSFSGGMKDAFCGIQPQKDRININLFRGADLEDPESLLEGSGKKNRHIKVRSLDALKSKSLAKLIVSCANIVRGSR